MKRLRKKESSRKHQCEVISPAVKRFILGKCQNQMNYILFGIKKSLQVRGTNIRDVVYDFDRRRTGNLPVNQFRRLLSSIGFNPSDHDFQILANELGQDDMIDTSRFIAAVQNSTENVKVQTQDYFPYLLEIYKMLSTQNAHFIDVIKPYDQTHRGLITKFDFLRAIGHSKAAIIVADAFADKKSDIIKYQDVHNAIEEAIQNYKPAQRSKPDAVDIAAKQLLHRGVDARAVFGARDRLNLGKLYPPIFKQLLSSTGIDLSPSQYNDIANYYMSEDQVDFLSFIKDIRAYDEVSKETLEKTRPPPPSYNLEDIISKIKERVLMRKLSLHSVFKELEEEVVTLYQFASILDNLNIPLTNGEIEYLTHYYRNQNNTIDKDRFLQNFTQFARTTDRFADNQIQDTIEFIKEYLQSKQIIMKPRFQKFDREHSGEFSVELVNSALAQVGLSLLPKELKMIEQQFQGKRAGYINWVQLAETIDPVYNVTPKQPLQKPEFLVKSAPIPKVSTTELSPEIIDLLKSINLHASRGNIVLLDEFRARDKNKIGKLPAHVFTPVMIMFFPKIASNKFEELKDIYGNAEFQYYDFCRDLEKVKNMPSSENKSAETLKRDEENFKLFLKTIKAYTLTKMIEPTDIFKSTDPYMTGYIRCDRLHACFALIKFATTNQQLDLLIDRYHDPEYFERFNYVKLCQDISAVKMNPQEAIWVLDPQKAEDDFNSHVQVSLLAIREKLYARRQRIGNLFSDCQSDIIPEQDFRNRIINIGFYITMIEIDRFVKKYGTEQGVNWRQFCTDFQNTVLIGENRQ